MDADGGAFRAQMVERFELRNVETLRGEVAIQLLTSYSRAFVSLPREGRDATGASGGVWASERIGVSSGGPPQPTPDVRRHRADWNPRAWRTELSRLSEPLDALEELEGADGSSVSRGYLIDLAVACAGGFTFEQALRLLTVSLVWGFGSTGYGPYRSRQILRHAMARPDALLNMADLASIDAGGAYRDGLWSRSRPAIRGLGTAFGTKFLYFASYAGAPRPRPLIYDANVTLALADPADYREGLLRAREVEGHRVGDGCPSPPPRLRTYEYVHYLGYAAEDPARRRASADSVEMRLFEEVRTIREAAKADGRALPACA
jgi:hypothetical protein